MSLRTVDQSGITGRHLCRQGAGELYSDDNVRACAGAGFFVLFGAHLSGKIVLLVLILVIVNIGYSAAGTLISAISAATKRNEVMLPILLFPLLLPFISLAIKATASAFDDRPFFELLNQLETMVAFCVIFVAAGYLLFPYAIRED